MLQDLESDNRMSRWSPETATLYEKSSFDVQSALEEVQNHVIRDLVVRILFAVLHTTSCDLISLGPKKCQC
jgi:hypothetical protein